jgi:hypothetical protein
MTTTNAHGSKRSGFGRPWVFLTVAVAIHVADEAVNDFPSAYNSGVRHIRDQLPLVLLPTVTFDAWLASLVVGVCFLAALSPWAYRGHARLIPIASVVAVFMFLNAVGHVAVSLYMNDWVAGVYSSPLLFLSSIWLWSVLRALPSANK